MLLATLGACAAPDGPEGSASRNAATSVVRYEYTTNGDYGWIFELETLRFISIGSDATETFSLCEPTDAFICLRTSAFVFAIPRAMPAARRWEYRKHFYAAGSDESRRILGRELRGFSVIESDEPDWHDAENPVFYFFSYERGLLIIEDMKHVWSVDVFLSKERCGFGAPASCWKFEPPVGGPS